MAATPDPTPDPIPTPESTADLADREVPPADARLIRDDDTTVAPGDDAAHLEWEQPDSALRDIDGAASDAEGATRAGFPAREQQPESQGATPLIAELGPDGEGDVTAEGR